MSPLVVLKKDWVCFSHLLLTSCMWLRQLRQHRIHICQDGFKLIFEELHVALIKRCPLRHGCPRLH